MDQALSMNHWNENLMMVMSCETTGPDPLCNSMYQFTCILLDSNFKMYKGVIPFNVYIKPEVDTEIMPKSVTHAELQNLIEFGLSYHESQMAFRQWLNKGPFQQTRKKGKLAQAFALGYDLPHQYPFILPWFGPEDWEEFFHPRFRDVLAASTFINDCCGMGATTVKYSKNDLSWIATQMLVEHERDITGLHKCIVIAECYRKMTHYYAYNKIGL